MKSNADKCHCWYKLLVSSNEKVTIKIEREKFLGVHLDSGLSFD